MPTKQRNPGGEVEAGGDATSATDTTGATMWYTALFANFGAKGSGAATIGIKLWTLVAGVRTLAVTISGTLVTFVGSLNLSGYLFVSGVQPGGLGANKSILDNSAGVARLFSNGPDAATNGLFNLRSQRSDGSNDITVLATDATGRIQLVGSTPATAAATGVAGTITWDANYIYICVAANTWKRVAIATW